MLLPKRVKYRRVQRGRLKGKATRGNKVTNGEYGLQALEPAWITSNQIEAARIAMTRYIKRNGQVWIKIFPDNGLQSLSRAELCLKLQVLMRTQLVRLFVSQLTSSRSNASLLLKKKRVVSSNESK